MQRSLDLDRPVLGRLRLEHVLHLSLFLLAAALRLAWLGYRPLHHDESIHAYYSWRILTVGPSDYRYDPVYHGPALYYLTAIFQGLLGPSDVSSRMLAAVTGLGLVALAWPLRTLIGRRESLFYAALVTLSPTFGYYSRSLRHDLPYAFFAFAGVVAFLHFVRSGRKRYAYLAGVAAGLAAATKEDVYLSIFTFGNALWMIGLTRLESSGLSLAERVARWATEVFAWLRRGWIPTATAVLIALTVALVLYTSLLTHPEEWNATSRALHYWWGQHEQQRIGGPWWYYLPLEIGYEALIFLPAVAMLVRWLVRGVGSRVEALFLVWTMLAFALYAWAQEKVPWLLIPVLLPQTVLAAHWLARRSARGLLWVSPLAIFTAWSLVCSNYLYDAPRTSEPPEAAHFEPLVYVQSTYDVAAILAEIEAASRALGTGKETPMVVVGDATWPLSWYLRDYPVHWNSLPRQTNAPIIVVDPDDATRLQKDLGERYTARRFAVRGWWQIEWDKMTPWTLLRFLAERRVWNPTGTTDAVMLLAKDLSPQGRSPDRRAARGSARARVPGNGAARGGPPARRTRRRAGAVRRAPRPRRRRRWQLCWSPIRPTTASRSSRRTARSSRCGAGRPLATARANSASPVASQPATMDRSTSPIPGTTASSNSTTMGDSSSSGTKRTPVSGARGRSPSVPPEPSSWPTPATSASSPTILRADASSSSAARAASPGR